VVSVKKKNTLFFMFLLCYSLAEILGIIITSAKLDLIEFWSHVSYYGGNGFFILSYIFLILKISKSLSIKYVFEHFKLHMVVLILLKLYLLYFIHKIINPNLFFKNDYYFELLYNIVLFSLVTISLLNYFYNDNRKSLYLFFGALFILVSEIMDAGFIFVDQRSILTYFSVLSMLAGFYFLYQQSKLLNTSTNENMYR